MSTAAVTEPREQEADDARRRWDRFSRHYDRQLWLERSAVSSAVELLAPGPDERCLDLGTGTGEVLRRLARRPDAPRSVLGIDFSAAMLDHVDALPAAWSLRIADVRALPLPNASFDAASASYLLHLLAPADLPLALAEIHRVLRPGGRLVTVTPAIPPGGPARPLAAALDGLAARRLERAGFELITSRWNLRGYPSLCVRSRAQLR